MTGEGRETNDTEHGTPFSDQEMQVLWNNADDPEVQLILIMCYSGWRIGEVLKLTTNLEEKYFQGGIKTKAGKNRAFVLRLLKHHKITFRDRAAGNVCKGLRPLARSIYRFFELYEGQKILSACQKCFLTSRNGSFAPAFFR